MTRRNLFAVFTTAIIGSQVDALPPLPLLYGPAKDPIGFKPWRSHEFTYTYDELVPWEEIYPTPEEMALIRACEVRASYTLVHPDGRRERIDCPGAYA